VLLVGISFAFGMPRCCGMRLFPIVSWAFRRGTGMGGGVRLGRKGHGTSVSGPSRGERDHVWRVRGLRASRHFGRTSQRGSSGSWSRRGVWGGRREGGAAAQSACRTTSSPGCTERSKMGIDLRRCWCVSRVPLMTWAHVLVLMFFYVSCFAGVFEG
jgi:hypothetical protein